MEILITAIGCALIFYIQLNIYRRRCFKKLDYRCFFNSSEAFEGEEIEFVEEIENHKILSLPVFKSELTASAELDFANTHSAITDGSRFVSSFFEVKGKSKVKRIWKLKCTKRGVYGIYNAVLVTSDIFGVEYFSYKPDFCLPKITVLPSEYPFDVRKIMNKFFFGELPVKNPPFIDPFFADGIREYTGKEPLRFINHNASAKKNRLMVNMFENSVENGAAIILDLNCRNETAEHNIRVCAYLLNILEKNRIRTELYITSDPVVHIRYGVGEIHLKSCLYALADADIAHTISLKSILNNADKTSFLITADEKAILSHKSAIIFTGYLSEPVKPCIIYVPERRTGNEKDC